MGPQGPQGIQGNAGATGPTGAGIELQGAYDNYGDFIASHPTGTPGEAWVVGGELFVAGPDGNWVNNGPVEGGATGATGATGAQGPQGAQGSIGAMGGIGAAGPMGGTGPQGSQGEIGPTGPQGAQGLTGATGSLGSTGPQGPQGIQGSTGTTGATGAGIELQGSYDNYGDFIASHPTGTPGEAWIIGGELFVAGPDGNWVNNGPVQGGATGATGSTGAQGPVGPQGPQGIQGNAGATGPTGAGIELQGAYDNYGDFIASHPTGTPGQAWIVGGELFIAGPDGNWVNNGPVEGGATGATGATAGSTTCKHLHQTK